MKLFNAQEIVALSGAHTLGRSRPERSGWGRPETKYTVWNHHLLFMNAEEHIVTKLHISCHTYEGFVEFKYKHTCKICYSNHRKFKIIPIAINQSY